MWASAVVVHDAAETTLCLAGSNSNSLMPLMNRPESSGSGAPFFLLLNGELFTTTRAPATRWPRMAPFASSGSACGSRNVPVHSTTSATPWSRQWMSFGSRASRRMTSSLPWALMRPRPSSTTVTSRTPDWPCRKRCRAPYVVSLAMYCARASSDVPTGRPRLMTIRSKSSCPRWCHSVSLPMRPSPLMPSVRCPPIACDPLPRRTRPLRRSRRAVEPGVRQSAAPVARHVTAWLRGGARVRVAKTPGPRAPLR